MKTNLKDRFRLPALAGGLGLILAGQVTAQTFTTLHSFSWGSDGAEPSAGLIVSGNTLYGTAQTGGTSRLGYGTVFAVNTDGNGFTTLHSFAGSDGSDPNGGLSLSGDTLYGTAAFSSGRSDSGTVFAVNTDGSGFTTLYSFTELSGVNYGINSDGAFPSGGLSLSGNTLYGTAGYGGSSGNGTVFAVNTDGSGFTTLHSFTALNNNTNSDGRIPYAGVILSDNTLYGTAIAGGSSDNGTVFAVNTDGSGFTTLHSFTGGGDGGSPNGGLILSGNTLYGTAYQGGSSGNGTVFAVNTDGSGFTTLHTFTASPSLSTNGWPTNSDGANPLAGLTLSGNTLYGTARYGGGSGNGTVFAVNTDGTGFTTLHTFTALSALSTNGWPINSDGANPLAGLTLSGNTLYGTAWGGGSSGYGTVFSLTLGPTVPAPPTVTAPQPQSLTVLSGQPAAFTVTATGAGPLSYQWMLGGAPIPGATTNHYAIPAAQLINAGDYSVVVTNLGGATTSGVATLTVVATVPLPFALNDNLTWTTDATVPWYGQTLISHDGIASAQTWLLPNAQQTSLRTVVAGPGTLSFWWKVSSEQGADYLTFSCGGTEQTNISGEVDWEFQTYLLPAGSQALQWTYSKDASGSAGQDAAWVDEVSFISGYTLPFIVAGPTNQVATGGTPVTFTVAAGGTPTLTYQWRFDGTNIAGATSTSFTITNPLGTDGGVYSVEVGNPYGTNTSASALLAVIPIAARGDNSLGQLVVPVGATNAIAVAAGAWHNLALRADGQVLAWGDDAAGQCDVPPGLKDVVAVAAGGYHSLALKGDGAVVCWGANDSGQVAPGPGVSNLIAITAGTWHSLALRADSTVVAWGDNTWGQSAPPPGLSNVVAIAAGGNHSLALRADGTVAAWGENTDSQGNYVGQATVPPGLTNCVGIAAGSYHSLVVKADGTVVVWGDNSEGQSQPPSLTNAVAVAGGGSHSLALRSDSTVVAWGDNRLGQCNVPSTLSNVVELAAGNSHTLLLLGSPPTVPQPIRPARRGSEFSLLLQTYPGRNYALAYKTSLTDLNWTTLRTIHGDGAMQFLVDPNASGAKRFYRVRQWSLWSQ